MRKTRREGAGAGAEGEHSVGKGEQEQLPPLSNALLQSFVHVAHLEVRIVDVLKDQRRRLGLKRR